MLAAKRNLAALMKADKITAAVLASTMLRPFEIAPDTSYGGRRFSPSRSEAVLGLSCRRALPSEAEEQHRRSTANVSEPAAHLALIGRVRVTKLLVKDAFLRDDLKSRDVKHESERAEQSPRHSEVDGPCHKKRDETEIHRVSRVTVGTARNESRRSLDIDGIDRCVCPAEGAKPCPCK